MALKTLLVSLLCISIAGGLDYKRYYGNSLVHILNVTWSSQHSYATPLNWVFEALTKHPTPSSQCYSDLIEFKLALDKLQPWAVQMADSFGGLLPGALSGNLNNLGSYDECVDMRSVGHTSNYCWVRLHTREGEHQNSSYVLHNVPFVFALCVPSTCHKHELETLLRMDLNQFDVSATCQDNPPSWGPWEIAGAVLFSILLLTVTMSTAYDTLWARNYDGNNDLWCSFSVSRNTKSLSASPPGKLACIEGLRVLSQFAVIIYHAWRDDLKNEVPVMNKFATNKFVRSWIGILFVAPTIAVDTYTVIGGFLLMYPMISKEKNNIVISQHLLNRFMRFYPPYFIGLLLMMTLAGMICDGPLCESVITRRQTTCRESWWANALCIHNVYPGIFKSCMSHTWYIAADWQLFLFLSPLIIIGLRKNKSLTMWAIVGVIIASVVAVFGVTVANNLKTETLLHASAADAELYFDTLYAHPFARLPSWGFGLLLGVFMHSQDMNKISLKRERVLLMWVLCALAMTSTLLVDLPFQQESYKYNSVESGLFNAITHPLWALGICWIIFSCSAGYGGIFNAFLSSQPFLLLGKLSYSAYLIHKLIVNLYYSGLRGSIYVAGYQQVTLTMGLIVLSYAAGYVFYLVAEVPFMNIAKYIQRKAKKTVVQEQTEPTDSGNLRHQPESEPAGFDAYELSTQRQTQFFQ